MSRTAANLKDRRFGKLFVLCKAESPNADEHAYWRCRCDCGRETLTSSASLLAGTSSCKPCSQVPKNPVWQQVYGLYKRNARRTKKAFELTTDQFLHLITSNCDYCGREPSQKLWQGTANPAHAAFRWNGIDRIDSDKGYVEGNVVPCCQPCNEMKSDKSRDEFLRLIAAIYRHHAERSVQKSSIGN